MNRASNSWDSSRFCRWSSNSSVEGGGGQIVAEKDQRGAHLPAQGRGNGRTEDARLIPLSKETKVRSWQKKANGQLTFEDRGGGTGHRNG